jgi:hypothetical protein
MRQLCENGNKISYVSHVWNADDGEMFTRFYTVELLKLRLLRGTQLTRRLNGLRGLEVTFPPHDPSDAGLIPAEVVEFFRTETQSFGRDFKLFDLCSRFTAR